MNLPNKLSLARIIATPVFLFFLVPGPLGQFMGLNTWGRYASVVLFILAALTDLLDGHIARKYNLITDLGKFLDPIADKLLVSAALIALIQTDHVSAWAVFIIIAREFIVTGIRVVAAGQGIVLAASNLGKSKTMLQMIAIVLLILQDFPLSLVIPFPFGMVVLWVAVLMTVVSGYDYLRKNLPLIVKSA